MNNEPNKGRQSPVGSTDLLDALHRAEKTMKDRAYEDYERYNPLDYDKCIIWVEATMREVRKEIKEASNSRDT